MNTIWVNTVTKGYVEHVWNNKTKLAHVDAALRYGIKSRLSNIRNLYTPESWQIGKLNLVAVLKYRLNELQKTNNPLNERRVDNVNKILEQLQAKEVAERYDLYYKDDDEKFKVGDRIAIHTDGHWIFLNNGVNGSK